MATSAHHAWMDESVHFPAGNDTPGLYLLAASVAEPTACEHMRQVLRALPPGRAKRLHWRDGDSRKRLAVATSIAQLEAHHTVVIGAPIDPQRQERARRLCLERLLHELHTLGVSHVWAEARSEALNRRDVYFFDALRSRGTLPDSLTLDFASPLEEPMLWLPDAVAGAVGLHRRGRDPEPYRLLKHRITEHDIALG